MANSTAPLSFNQHVTQRHAIQEYLVNLPILDRRVLQLRLSERKDPAQIALQMRISKVHVERILARAQDFTNGLRSDQKILASFPVWTASPTGAC